MQLPSVYSDRCKIQKNDTKVIFLVIVCDFRENYLFNCQCRKCLSQADDPDVTSSEEEEDSDAMDDN